jgi:hypothetical protein
MHSRLVSALLLLAVVAMLPALPGCGGECRNVVAENGELAIGDECSGSAQCAMGSCEFQESQGRCECTNN